MNYTEIVQNNIYDRGDLSELPEGAPLWDIDYYGSEVTNAFNSVFYHSEEFKIYIEKTGKVRGYKGKVWTDYLHWDFDGDNVEDVYTEVRRFYDHLVDTGFSPRNLRCCYSGSKGFHVYYVSPELEIFKSYDMQPIVKKLALGIADGFKYVDNSVYNRTGVIRTLNSKHPSTNNYKIVVSVLMEEIEDILNSAKTQQEAPSFDPIKEQNNTIIELYRNIIDDVPKDDNEFVVQLDRAANQVEQTLIEGLNNGFQKGTRNNSMLRVAGLLHSNGINNDLIDALLSAVNRGSKDPLPYHEISSVVRSVCQYPVEKRVGSEDEDDLIDKIVTFKQAGKSWAKLMELSGEFSFGPRYTHINEVMSITLLGDLAGLLSASGVGKSTLLFDLLREYAEFKNCDGLGFSLEMSKESVFFRGATISYTPNEIGDVDSKELAYNLLHNEGLLDKVSNEWDRVKIVDETVGVLQIEEYINIAKTIYPSLRIIGVDYMQNIVGMDDINKASVIAKELKNIAKRTNTIIVLAMQTKKDNLDPYMRTDSRAIEGRASLTQCLDYLIGFWRSTDNRLRLHGEFLKTRWVGTGGQFDLEREGLRYTTCDFTVDKAKGEL